VKLHVLDSLATCAIDGIEVDYFILAVGIPCQVPKNSIYSSSGVGDKNDSGNWNVKDL
jgi:hypothetical protein